jgi:hypothetical protein
VLVLYGQLLRGSTLIEAAADRFRDPDYKIAWYIVALAVLLTLGATVLLGALVYCMARGLHLSTTIDIGGGRYLVGCV